MRYVKVPYTGKIIRIGKDTIKGRSKALKSHFTRERYDIQQRLVCDGFPLRYCGFCHKPNERFFLVTEINDEAVDIIAIDYTYGGIQQEIDFCFTNRECPGKRLNPNSAEFVSITRGMKMDNALLFLRSRNSSPFYPENHASITDYQKSQQRNKAWYDQRGKSVTETHQRAGYAKSLLGLIERFGEDEGKAIYDKHCTARGITVANMMRKHSCDEDSAKIIVADHTARASQSIENFTRRHGYSEGHIRYFEYICKKTNYSGSVASVEDLVDYCVSFVRRSGFRRLDTYPLAAELLTKPLVRNGLGFFEISVDELCAKVVAFAPEVCSLSTKKFFKQMMGEGLAGYGFLSYTKDGQLLRSSHELNFYTMLMSVGGDAWKIRVDQNYPGSQLRYDFYFPIVDVYVEICGFGNWDEYIQKVTGKREQFGSWLLWNEADFESAIERLKVLHAKV